jgi:hypothetical protein
MLHRKRLEADRRAGDDTSKRIPIFLHGTSDFLVLEPLRVNLAEIVVWTPALDGTKGTRNSTVKHLFFIVVYRIRVTVPISPSQTNLGSSGSFCRGT